MDLDIGIKNSFEVVNAYPQMIDKWDFAVNEECFYYGEVGCLRLTCCRCCCYEHIKERSWGLGPQPAAFLLQFTQCGMSAANLAATAPLSVF
jgi:hypothetical protein